VAESGFRWREDPQWQRLVEESKQDPIGPIHTYQSPHDPWLTNSYFFETERGVVLVDTQFFRSSVSELWEMIKARTSGDLTFIVITHAHPDHCWGTTLFRKVAPRAAVISSHAVTRDLERRAPHRAREWSRKFGDEVLSDVSDVVYPEVRFDRRLSLDLGDLEIELVDFGPAEAPAQVAVWLPSQRTLISGDLIMNRQHLYFSDGGMPRLANWYTIIQELERLRPDFVMTGHQGVADASIFAETKAWIASFLGLVASELGPNRDPERIEELTPAARARIAETMRARFADWFDPIMMDRETVLEHGLIGVHEGHFNIGALDAPDA
jgi:glyoxylase-like metal-dependent hydrolase (beta-lactamase superfamily II)